MSELKLPRLLAAAKEFNIGQDTLIEFLSKKGFPKDDLKPTAKLTEDQYYALQAEFQSDKVAKNKADHVELPKGAPSTAEPIVTGKQGRFLIRIVYSLPNGTYTVSLNSLRTLPFTLIAAAILLPYIMDSPCYG